MRIRIRVTKNHIKKAIAAKNAGEMHSKSCPIAQALKGKKIYFQGVNYSDINLGPAKVALPKKASNKIDAFDTNQLVTPFSFTINIPKKCINK